MGRIQPLSKARLGAERLAEELLEDYECRPKAPVDIYALATKLGLVIEETSINQDGRFLPGPPPTILIKAGQPKARERFTVAHEIAHYAVRGEKGLGLRNEFTSEETLCNSLGAALLIPGSWARDNLKKASRRRDLATLSTVAAQAQVSMSAALIRLRDLFAWEKTLLHWSRVGGEWSFDGEAGVYPWEQGAIMPSRNLQFVLNDFRNSFAGTQQCQIPLRVGRREIAVPAELKMLQRGVVALIDAPGLLAPHEEGLCAA